MGATPITEHKILIYCPDKTLGRPSLDTISTSDSIKCLANKCWSYQPGLLEHQCPAWLKNIVKVWNLYSKTCATEDLFPIKQNKLHSWSDTDSQSVYDSRGALRESFLISKEKLKIGMGWLTNLPPHTHTHKITKQNKEKWGCFQLASMLKKLDSFRKRHLSISLPM